MSKKLLTTTALVGAFLSFEASAAEVAKTQKGATLTISGESSFNMFFGRQDAKKDQVADAGGAPIQDYTIPTRDGSALFTVDNSKLNFQVAGKTDPGMEFKFNVILTGDTGAGRAVKENFLTLNGSWGTLILGDTPGPEDKAAFGAYTFAVGTGGIDGNFNRFVGETNGVITTVDLAGDTGDATKAIYYTPRFEGFQMGVSFTPDTKHSGEDRMNYAINPGTNNGVPFDKNSVAASLNFMRQFAGGFDLKASLTGIMGKTKAGDHTADAATNTLLERKNTRAWAAGLVMGYAGFELGGEYLDNRDSGVLKNDIPANTLAGQPVVVRSRDFDGGKGWNIGAAYTFKATKLSINYYNTKRKNFGVNATGKILVVGAQHQFAPGFTGYIEYAHHRLKNDAFAQFARLTAFTTNRNTVVVGNQKSNVFILGTKIKF